MNHDGPSANSSLRIRLLTVLPLLVAVLLWVSGPALQQMVQRWSRDPRYSHGYLVPVFAACLLWLRRRMLGSKPLGSSWWGIPLIVVGAAMLMLGGRYYVAWLEGMSLLASLAGLALLVGGVTALRWSLPSIGFLFFMIPLPYRLEVAMGYPLQRIATLASNYSLQTLGLPAVAEGNIILLGDIKIGVVEACNGLGMLFTFFAFASAVVLVIRLSWLQKILVLLSAIPISLAANIMRITLTGLLHATMGGRVADAVYHDLAGWLMMPLALAALWGEIFLLSRLFIETVPATPFPIGLLAAGSANRSTGGVGGKRLEPWPGEGGRST